MKVKLSEPEIAGDYVLDERLEDGSLVLRPDTSAAAIRKRLGSEPISDEEFEGCFGHLPTDGEG